MKTAVAVIVVLFGVSLPSGVWAQVVPPTTAQARAMCDNPACPDQSHIACSFHSDSNVRCEGRLLAVPKQKLIDAHNKARKSEVGAKPALPPVKWSDELALAATFNVMSCKFAHDRCRSTKKFPSAGQNLAVKSTRGYKPDIEATLLGMVQSWVDERKQPACAECIKSYPPNPKAMCGHYTQIVRRDSTKVGCAAIAYQEDGWDTVLMACNYEKTNMINEPVY